MRRENDRFQHGCPVSFNISSRHAGYAMNNKIDEPPSSPSLNYEYFLFGYEWGRKSLGEY